MRSSGQRFGAVSPARTRFSSTLRLPNMRRSSCTSCMPARATSWLFRPAISAPSKTIDPQFVSHLVETASGEVHCGLLVRQTDNETVLKLADGKEITIPASEIDRSVPQQKSLMPELLLRDMTAQQAADLLEFLAGLK